MSDNTNLLSMLDVKMTSEDVATKFKRDLLEVTIENSLHLPDVATFVLTDVGLSWADDSRLLQGLSVQVLAKTSKTSDKIFDGEIVEIEPSFIPGKQRIIVRAFDRMHRLSRGRHVRSFIGDSDSDIIKKLAEEVELTAQVGSASQTHEYVFQNNETNLEFLQKRAAALGYLLFVHGEELHCEAPKKEKTVQLKWGETLQEFHPRLTTIGQVDKVTARGWDPTTKQPIVEQATEGSYSPKVGIPGNSGQVAHDAFKLKTEVLVADRPIRKQPEATTLAQATMDRLDSSFVEAEGVCSGDPHLVAGASVEITAVGTHFSGTYFVTNTTHIHNNRGSYITRFTISALEQTTLLSLLGHDEARPMGLCIGIVTDNNDDKGLGRVKVKYPWLTNEHASDWARVISVGGGDKRGIEFIPEVNDEVLVGFEMGDIHYPYILGGLWNGKDDIPEKSEKVVSGGKVQKRLLRSRLGHTITLDDSDDGGGITIEDNNGNQIVMDKKGITVKDKNKNEVTMTSKGITMTSEGQIQINGKGITLNGEPSTVDIKGTTINLN